MNKWQCVPVLALHILLEGNFSGHNPSVYLYEFPGQSLVPMATPRLSAVYIKWNDYGPKFLEGIFKLFTS